jgi:hypothetical protein
VEAKEREAKEKKINCAYLKREKYSSIVKIGVLIRSVLALQ